MTTPEILKLLEPCDAEFYEQVPPPVPDGFPPRDTPEALLTATNKAHDNIRKLVRENDNLRAALIGMHKDRMRDRKIFLVVMGLTWTALGWALDLLIPYAIHGMAK